MAKPYNPLPWSYSSLTSFETCPKRHYHLRVAKDVVEAQSQALVHGNEIHRAIDQHLTGKAPLPAKYASMKPLVDSVLAAPGETISEQRVALTEDGKPSDYWGANTWWRGAIDAAKIGERGALACDWKSGAPKDDPDQLKLFAVATFAHYPHIERVTTAYVWLGHNRVTSAVYHRTDAEQMLDEFRPRVEQMQAAWDEDNYPARPSGLCRKWCPVPNRLCPHSGA